MFDKILKKLLQHGTQHGNLCPMLQIKKQSTPVVEPRHLKVKNTKNGQPYNQKSMHKYQQHAKNQLNESAQSNL